MRHKVIGGLVTAAAVGTLMIGPVVGMASAASVPTVHQQGPDSRDWRDPGAPPGIDRHCDRHGFWHNDDHDGPGHPDGRCHPW